MPYISQERRTALDYPAIGDPLGSPQTAGELNYLFTRLLWRYLGPNPNYQKYNDAMGALEGCKLELYARRIRPYEDKKIVEHGDVY